MNTKKLGRLEKVDDLKSVWSHEAHCFTPWLAKNLKLLGDAIGLELVAESTEVPVGRFNADIVCRTEDDDHVVLIENQLEKTDHKHLGQVLTYSAGLKAVTVVWIAKKFVEQHSAVLTWLNEKMGQDINFFGIEIELLKIDDSNEAPNFNVVVRPNQWTKVSPENTEMTTEHRRLFSYWDAFLEVIKRSGFPLKPAKPSATHLGISSGYGKVRFYAVVSTAQNCIEVRLRLRGGRREFFSRLAQEKEEIEKSIQHKLEWLNSPQSKAAYIILRMNDNPLDESKWVKQHAWLCENLNKFYEVFMPRIKKIISEGE